MGLRDVLDEVFADRYYSNMRHYFSTGSYVVNVLDKNDNIIFSHVIYNYDKFFKSFESSVYDILLKKIGIRKLSSKMILLHKNSRFSIYVIKFGIITRRRLYDISKYINAHYVYDEILKDVFEAFAYIPGPALEKFMQYLKS